MEDKILIVVNKRAAQLQISYNNDFAKAVNNILAELKKSLPELTDSQLRIFLKDHAALAEELTAKARAEYDSYVSTMPESVRNSMKFQCPASEIINKIHSRLPVKDPLMKVNATEIKGGKCVLTPEGKQLITDKCSVYGDERLQRIWKTARDAAKSLNELNGLLRGDRTGLNPVESWGRWIGLIMEEPTAKERFTADIDRLKMLS